MMNNPFSQNAKIIAQENIKQIDILIATLNKQIKDIKADTKKTQELLVQLQIEDID